MLLVLNTSEIRLFNITKLHRNKWEACLIDFNGNLFPKKNLLVQYFPSCAKTICVENRSDILGLLMLQKERKTYFGTALLVGLRKVRGPLL